jgi:hypothetical protein
MDRLPTNPVYNFADGKLIRRHSSLDEKQARRKQSLVLNAPSFEDAGSIPAASTLFFLQMFLDRRTGPQARRHLPIGRRRFPSPS